MGDRLVLVIQFMKAEVQIRKRAWRLTSDEIVNVPEQLSTHLTRKGPNLRRLWCNPDDAWLWVSGKRTLHGR